MQPTTRLTALIALGLALVLAAPAPADAAPARKAAARKQKRKKPKEPSFAGYQVPRTSLRAEPLPRPSGHLKLYNVNYRQPLEVDLYNPDGTMNDEVLAQLNHFWRCRRTGTEKPIDPRVFEILSTVQDHFAGRTIELVSGFRNTKSTGSYHFHGSASDFRVIGVSDKELHNYVASLDTGHMGLGRYPRSHFIHVDVRPDASYRWTDWSGPGEDGASRASGKKAKKTRKRNA